jgi:glycosyltransferase involved in cell wall biosynthesis
MRILQIGPIPPEVGGQTGGGVASHLWALAPALVNHGHTVGVLGDNFLVKDPSSVKRDSVQLFGLTRIKRSITAGTVLNPCFWWKIIRIKIHFGPMMSWKGALAGLLNYHRVIKAFKPDIIHIHHLEYRFPFVYFTAGDRIPILTTVHSTSFIEFGQAAAVRERKKFVRRNLDLARNLIFVSQFLEKRFEALFPGTLEEKNTAIIYNPVDGTKYYPITKEEAREKLGLRPDGTLLLFVGKLISHKGLDILIEAGSRLHERGLDFQLLVVGSGPEQAELERQVTIYGLNEQVCFEGYKSQGELFLYYNAADLLVLPSAMESFGLVFVEAMLCGCPVIGRADVLEEILPSERCGVYLPSSNPDDWAEAITKTLQRTWSKEGIQALSQVYTWEVLGDKYDRVYTLVTD